GRARRARDGECGAEHEREPVLHRHRGRVPLARRQAHGVRARHRRHGRRRRDLRALDGRARSPARGRRHRARRARLVSSAFIQNGMPYQSAATTAAKLAAVAMPIGFPNRNAVTVRRAATIAMARTKKPVIASRLPAMTIFSLSSARKRSRWIEGVAIRSADETAVAQSETKNATFSKCVILR